MVKKKIHAEVTKKERLRGTKTSIVKERSLFRLYPEIQWQFLRRNPDYIKDYLDYEQKKEFRKVSVDTNADVNLDDLDTLLESKEIATFEELEFKELEENYAFKWSLKKLVHYSQEELNPNNHESFIDKSFMEMVCYSQLANSENYLTALSDGTYEESPFLTILEKNAILEKHAVLQKLAIQEENELKEKSTLQEKYAIQEKNANLKKDCRVTGSEDLNKSRYLLVCLDLQEVNYKQAKVLVSKFIDEKFKEVNKDKVIGNFPTDQVSIKRYIDIYEHMVTVIKKVSGKSDGELSLNDLKGYLYKGIKIGGKYLFTTLADGEVGELGVNDKKTIIGAFEKAVEYIDLAPNIPFANIVKKSSSKTS